MQMMGCGTAEPRGFQHSSARALMARDSYALLPPAEISHAPPL